MLLDKLSQVAERFGELEQCISDSRTWIRTVFAAERAIVILRRSRGCGETSDGHCRSGMFVPVK